MTACAPVAASLVQYWVVISLHPHWWGGHTVGRAGQPPTLGVARLINVDLAHYATVTNVFLKFTKPT